MKLFSVFISNLEWLPKILISSKMVVEYMHIKLYPVKLLNKAIAIQTHVAFLLVGSISACQIESLSYLDSVLSYPPASSSSISFSWDY